jgi:hypothetical protein
LSGRPTKQIYSVTLPKHVIITYECMIWTDYVEQNNKIMETINFASKDYWGDKERFKFRTRVEGAYTTDIEVNSGEDRNVMTTFNLITNGYLLNSDYVPSLDNITSTTNKLFTVRKIKLQEQVVSSAEMDIIKRNAKVNTFEDTSGIKDKNTDFNYVDGVGIEAADYRIADSEIPTTKQTVNVTLSAFHPAPSRTNEYGENGWIAYNGDYIYIYQYPVGWLRKAIATFDYDFSTNTYISGYECDGTPITTDENRRPINTAFRIFSRFPDKTYHQVPYQSTDYGEDGWMSFDGSFFYIYSQGLWRRVPVSTFESF